MEPDGAGRAITIDHQGAGVVPDHGPGHARCFPQHPSMHASLVLSGAGIARGARITRAKNVDVAPTIARLLGMALPSATGRVLTEALQRD